MKRLFYLLCLAGISMYAWAQTPASAPDNFPEVGSTWPGIQMQILKVVRIPGNRLLVEVRLLATPKAPPVTMIGYPPVIPPDATKEELETGFGPSPYSLEVASMTDERTQQRYNALRPNPKGPYYLASVVLASLSPGQGQYMSVQFPVPPPPPPDDAGRVPEQTVSILLPKAKGPITRVVIPPETPSSAVP
jgi:hypothetical protein